MLLKVEEEARFSLALLSSGLSSSRTAWVYVENIFLKQPLVPHRQGAQAQRNHAKAVVPLPSTPTSFFSPQGPYSTTEPASALPHFTRGN